MPVSQPKLMRTLLTNAFVVAVALAVAGAAADRRSITIAVGQERIDVKVDDTLFTSLHTATGPRKLYLHPLLTASGKRVTRAFPMEQVSGESTDHPHQRGVWIGAEQLSGMDFWENEPSENNPRAGSVVLTDVSDVHSGVDEGRFTIRANWISAAGKNPIVETRTMAFRAPSADQR